ncbi:MAG: SurA N-terminal domain-containing protein, partial [Oligoflexia bacterium]|nr:SurA N-terminal domain-containing protein [Oligoflexia bacterium]
MFIWIREKFGTVVIGGIIAFIAFVFVFSGVFNPKATRGLHEGAVAGKVNGDSITIGEYNRALSQRVEYFKNMTGGKLTEDQIKAFRLRDLVFQDLVRRKLLVQEAGRKGMLASDEQVRDSIREIPAFQKDGKFDLVTYKRVLEANQYSAGTFERMVRE